MNWSRLLVALLMMMLTTVAAAQDGGSLWWGFHHDAGVPDNYLGVSKATTYEAAIHVDGSAQPVAGTSIVAVRLPFRDAEHIDSLTLWLTSELDAPKLDSIFVGKPQAGWNVVALPQPAAIPAEGLYVGYTFRVTKLDGLTERPLVMCNDVSDGGLNLRVADVKQYADWFTSKRYGSLALQLELTGDALQQGSVAVEAIQSNNVVATTADSLQVMLTNHGTATVNTLQYAYTFGSEQRSGSCQMSEPLPNVYGAQTAVSVPVTAPAATGRLDVSLTLTDVNGVANTNARPTATTQTLSLLRKPHHRTVMEEYTGTWCSACPRGFAGIARLKNAYPDDFIAVSVHVLNGDPMDVYYDYYYVMNATQFPSCRFDRGPLTDPYDGDITDGHFHADQNFLAASNILAPADLSVKAGWASDSLCTISSTVDFAFDDDECRYALAYVMTEDSLRGPEGDHAWHQKNNFSDPSMAYYVEDDMQPYVTATGTMLDDVVYNDVVLAMSDLRGISGSLTGAQVAGVPVTHQWQLKRTAVSQHRENIHVVALLIDTQTKRIANAAICDVAQPAAIEGVQHPALNARPSVFDMQGRRLTNTQPHRGLVIVRQADGSTRKQMY